jgi:DNA-binding response OmpR family regulator
LEVGELRLDPASRRVWLRGTETPFTAREFSVLEFFVHHPDEVLAKQDILDHVWDFDFDGDPNIVEVYVRRLRAKLEPSADRLLIETVRGAGYRLVIARV